MVSKGPQLHSNSLVINRSIRDSCLVDMVFLDVLSLAGGVLIF